MLSNKELDTYHNELTFRRPSYAPSPYEEDEETYEETYDDDDIMYGWHPPASSYSYNVPLLPANRLLLDQNVKIQ